MDFTMLRQICRRGRLAGFVRDYINLDSVFGEALRILFPEAIADPVEPSAPTHHSDLEAAQYNSKGVLLSPEIYNVILELVNSESSTLFFRHCNNLPHPLHALVLPPLANPIRKIEHNGRGYTSFLSHPGNSSISYYMNGNVDSGFITSIWSQVLQGKKRIFIVVAPHTPLSAPDATCSPYTSRIGLLGMVVYSQPTLARPQVVIQPSQIRGHVAYYSRPPGTFGIKVGVCILIDSLHRNRK